MMMMMISWSPLSGETQYLYLFFRTSENYYSCQNFFNVLLKFESFYTNNFSTKVGVKYAYILRQEIPVFLKE